MKNESEELYSDFGKGFTYNLFLFAKHCWKYQNDLNRNRELKRKYPDKELWSDEYTTEMWFNGAADHLFELEIPPQYVGTEIGKLAKELQDKGLRYRNTFSWTGDKAPTVKDFDKFFEQTEELMMMIDKDLGVEPIEATWK